MLSHLVFFFWLSFEWRMDDGLVVDGLAVVYDCRKAAFWKSRWRQRVYIILIAVCRRIVQIDYADCWFDGPWWSIQWQCLADVVVFRHYLSQSNETERCRLSGGYEGCRSKVMDGSDDIRRQLHCSVVKGAYTSAKWCFGIWGDWKSACLSRGYWDKASLQKWRPNAQKNILG